MLCWVFANYRYKHTEFEGAEVGTVSESDSDIVCHAGHLTSRQVHVVVPWCNEKGTAVIYAGLEKIVNSRARPSQRVPFRGIVMHLVKGKLRRLQCGETKLRNLR